MVFILLFLVLNYDLHFQLTINLNDSPIWFISKSTFIRKLSLDGRIIMINVYL